MPVHSRSPLYECDACESVVFYMKEIDDLLDRLEPGDVVPEGGCPKCGGLCHPWVPSRQYMADTIGRMVEALSENGDIEYKYEKLIEKGMEIIGHASLASSFRCSLFIAYS